MITINVYRPDSNMFVTVKAWRLGGEIGWSRGNSSCLLKINLLDFDDETIYIFSVGFLKFSASVFFSLDD